MSLADFEILVSSWGLRYFKGAEFFFKGASHSNPGSNGFGLNTDPPKALWNNMEATALVLDEIRDRINTPLIILSAYRSKAYNSSISGAGGSFHMKFMAADIRSPNANANQLAAVARDLRHSGMFKGGIGVYDTFIHVDTRGTNADWFGS